MKFINSGLKRGLEVRVLGVFVGFFGLVYIE